MMIGRVRFAGSSGYYWPENASLLFVPIAIVVFSMQTMPRTDAQTISLSEIESVWEKTAIANVTVEFAVTAHNTNEPFLLPKELGGGAIELAPMERFRFRRVSSVGMRLDHLDSPGRSWNLMDGHGTSLNGPSKAMEGLNSAIIKFAGETEVEKDWTTNCMLYWIEPLSTKHLSSLTKNSDLAIRSRNVEESGGEVELVVNEELSMVLAKKYSWRPISIKRGGPNGKMQSLTELQYSFSKDGDLLLDGFSSKRFSSAKQVMHLSAAVSSRKFGDCDRSKIELEIPNFTLVTNNVGSKEFQYVIRKDGSIRQYDRSKEPQAKTWTEIIDSEPPSANPR